MSPSRRSPETDAARAAAAEWCLRLAGPDLSVEDYEALRRWCEADPRHRDLLDTAVGVWRGMETEAVAPDMISLRAAALEDFRRAQTPKARSQRRWAPRWAAAGAVVAVVLAGGVWTLSTPQVYTTGEGERRVVELSDGSTASLDAATVVRVRYDGNRRQLWLDRGRAKFAVAKDPLRPFSVDAGANTVVATGTEFSVERLPTQVRVVLYEGHVAVLASKGSSDAPRPLRIGAESADKALLPGHELVAENRAETASIQATDPVQSLSWEGGQLVFTDEPLALAVERLNRYGKVKLRVADDSARAVTVNGVFRAGDVTAFVDGVTAISPLRARMSENMIVLESDPSRQKRGEQGSGLPM